MSKRKGQEKKSIAEMNTKELAEHLFPKELKEKLDQIAHVPGSIPKSRSSRDKG